MVHNVAESYLHRALVHTQFPPLDLTSTLLIVIQGETGCWLLCTVYCYTAAFPRRLVHHKLVLSVITSLWGHSKLKWDGHDCHNYTFLKFLYGVYSLQHKMHDCLYTVSVCPSQKRKVVTIRQRAESISIWEGTDHFLVSHHFGSGIVHLSVKKIIKGIAHNIKQKYTNPMPRMGLWLCVQFLQYNNEHFTGVWISYIDMLIWVVGLNSRFTAW